MMRFFVELERVFSLLFTQSWEMLLATLVVSLVIVIMGSAKSWRSLLGLFTGVYVAGLLVYVTHPGALSPSESRMEHAFGIIIALVLILFAVGLGLRLLSGR